MEKLSAGRQHGAIYKEQGYAIEAFPIRSKYRVEQKKVTKLCVKCCVPTDGQAVAGHEQEFSNRGPFLVQACAILQLY